MTSLMVLKLVLSANVDPTQTYTAAADKGTLTLTPGGDETVVPVATLTEAGLMSAADKNTLNNLITTPGGVLSLVAGNGININTATDLAPTGTPEVNVKFAGTGADSTTLVLPSNILLLGRSSPIIY